MKKTTKMDIIRNTNTYYVYITYQSKYSKGQLIINSKFFIEKYKKLYRLLKDCKIIDILIKDRERAIAITYIKDMFNTWLWLMGHEKL